MGKVTTLLIIVFVLALGAGVTAGMLASRLPGSTATPAASGEQHSWLAEQLDLTREQSEQMRDIWEGVRTDARKCFQQADDLEHERDEEVAKFLTPEQRIQYNQVTQKYATQMKDLAAQRQAAFEKAVTHTMKILRPDQQKRYDQILKDRVGRGPGPAGWLPETGVAP
jgi:Spy/CpxP family protein refolding chaperone